MASTDGRSPDSANRCRHGRNARRVRATVVAVLAVAMTGLAAGGCAQGSQPAGQGGADAMASATSTAGSPGQALAETPSSVGQTLYLRECATCHGEHGEGQPDWMITKEDGSLPAPPHDATGHTWHHADAELVDIIAKGGVLYMANSNMPGYGEQLTEEEIVAVLDYIKTWWGPRERSYQADRTMDWERMMEAQATQQTDRP